MQRKVSIGPVLEGCDRIARIALLILLLVQISVVGLRYFLGTGSSAIQEAVLASFALATIFGIPVVQARDAHVRVDIFYAGMRRPAKRRIDLFGTVLFLLPLCGVMIWSSIPYVRSSWAVLEGSRQIGGLPGVFLLKTLLLILPALLIFTVYRWMLAQIRGKK